MVRTAAKQSNGRAPDKGRKAKPGLARVLPEDGEQVVELPLSSIRPATINGKVYKPIDPNAPDIRDLADSIRRQDLQHPIRVERRRPNDPQVHGPGGQGAGSGRRKGPG